jgi:CrcB protein
LARTPATVAAVAAGGFIGALGRYEVGLAWPAGPGGFPSATFTINTSGAFLLGLLLTCLLERFPTNRYLRPFVCVGVLGAWTTMSTLAAETDLLVRGGHLAMAICYVAATLIAGIGATVAGIGVARHVPRRS